ncbi:DUF484 family protein [Robbsia andropogonis]|uniref:DUF484 family protein n=1 Tax=Robbsia andropogonis TaxID=28092 RepID=UPI002A69C698|nr:DUF484 family protein [Robbsia andropogonis]
MNESDVADFLLANPQFLERHPDVLARQQLGNPHGGRVVSLPQRQIEIVREKNRQLERRLNELVRYGHENDGYAARLDRLACQLLLTDDANTLPDIVRDGLRTGFDVPSVAVRIWPVFSSQAVSSRADAPDGRTSGTAAPRQPIGGTGDAPAADGTVTGYSSFHLPAGWSAPVDNTIRAFATGLGKPYCGKNTGFAAAAWLDAVAPAAPASAPSVPATSPYLQPVVATSGAMTADDASRQAMDRPPPSGSLLRSIAPNEAATQNGSADAPLSTPPGEVAMAPGGIASIAMIPLRVPNADGYVDPDTEAFGLIVLGSPDPQRFHSAMATDLLSRIGALASAALSRVDVR